MATVASPPTPPTFAGGRYSLNATHAAILTLPPLLALGAMVCGVPLDMRTLAVAVVFYFVNGFGITVGYHRLFSHRSFTAHWALQALMAVAGGGAMQGSIKWWSRNHRIHHRYIDTDKDPYNAKRGFIYTHVGWMLMKTDYSVLGRVDITDLKRNRIVALQHRYYFAVALVGGVLLPMAICGLGWGDWTGGYFYAALAKMVVVHHTTFFVNSLAHSPLFGRQLFSRKHSSHDSWLCALLTLGEGYHNFHHEFAHDYRNGLKWYQWDPSKWVIRVCEIAGLAWDVVRVPASVIERNRLSVVRDELSERIATVQSTLSAMENRTKPTETWTWDDIHARVARGEKLLVVGSYVLDMCKRIPIGGHGKRTAVWYDQHPGGRHVLDSYVGKDATQAFSGGVYAHSDGATNLIPHLRVATLAPLNKIV